MLLLASLLAVTAAIKIAQDRSASIRPALKAAPQFPQQYFVQGTFRIPYFQTEETITAWTDVVNDMQKVEYYGGMDTYIYRYDDGLAYEIVPIIDQKGCFATNVTGPMLSHKVGDPVQKPQVLPLVPDISSWTYNGTASIRGIQCDAWSFIVTNVTAYGTGVSYYTMYVNNNVPVRLLMQGINFIMGSHPDVYIFDYHQFVGNVSDAAFDVPSICTNENRASNELAQRRAAHRLGAIHQSLGRVVPPMHTYMDCAHDVSGEFHAFTLQHMKRYASCGEHAHRQQQYMINKAFVAQWNANPANTHTVELNHLADLSDEEYRSLVLMPKSRATGQQRRDALAQATASVRISSDEQLAALPTSVDWRLKGVVTPVKDQGACGSCWTFGSAGSLEGMWAIKTSKLISLSEQNIVDCAWNYFGNAACDGGLAPGAYQYLMNAGGMGTEASYPYLAQDGWCNPNDHSSGVIVKGYVNITDEASLLAAVAAGPVAIAIDASLPSLRFYKSGVYNDPACKNDADDLDHEVLAVGYDTDATTGLQYLIVKNSWSTWWGNQGYFNLATKNNECGAATSATQPIV